MWNKTEQVTALLTEHLRRRPGMQPRDIYKLLYQGVRGPEHLITSPQAFREYLLSEWQTLDPTADDLLTESIRPDGSLLRLNLRPFKASGGSLEMLTTACLETARHPWGTQSELQKAWGIFITCHQAGLYPDLSIEAVESLTTLLHENGFPPMHHSQVYRRLYRPAYRLVAVDFELHPPL